jgi:hypothetical protein
MGALLILASGTNMVPRPCARSRAKRSVPAGGAEVLESAATMRRMLAGILYISGFCTLSRIRPSNDCPCASGIPAKIATNALMSPSPWMRILLRVFMVI